MYLSASSQDTGTGHAWQGIMTAVALAAHSNLTVDISARKCATGCRGAFGWKGPHSAIEFLLDRVGLSTPTYNRSGCTLVGPSRWSTGVRFDAQVASAVHHWRGRCERGLTTSPCARVAIAGDPPLMGYDEFGELDLAWLRARMASALRGSRRRPLTIAVHIRRGDLWGSVPPILLLTPPLTPRPLGVAPPSPRPLPSSRSVTSCEPCRRRHDSPSPYPCCPQRYLQWKKRSLWPFVAYHRMLPNEAYVHMLDQLFASFRRLGWAHPVSLEFHAEGSRPPASIVNVDSTFTDVVSLGAARGWASNARLGAESPAAAFDEMCTADVLMCTERRSNSFLSPRVHAPRISQRSPLLPPPSQHWLVCLLAPRRGPLHSLGACRTAGL